MLWVIHIYGIFMRKDKKWYEGKKFNWWTIVKHVNTKFTKRGKISQAIQIYKIRCSCGFEKVSNISDIVYGRSTRCKSCSVKNRYKNEKNKQLGNKSPGWKGTKDIPRAMFTKVTYNAKKRGLKCDITIEDLQELWELQDGRCKYSNRALIFNNKSFKTKKSNKIYNFASLDRIDSSKGYIKGNIQWVCIAVNLAKQQFNENEFFDLISDIYKSSIL